MKKERRFDIDWIRVIVFDILIIYHVGMFFVEWDWHIKNNEIIDWVEYPMRFVNQWRIPILFVVSGMGTRFALSFRTGKTYIKERIIRLLIPLLVGMFIIVPPQVYLERLTQGALYQSFLEFYPDYFNGIYPQGNFSWHHLWFLPYLLVMSITATPLFLSLRESKNKIILFLQGLMNKSPISLYILVLPLALIEYSLADKFPITHAFLGDWYGLTLYFLLFIFGFILICIGNSFWTAVNRLKISSLIIGVLCFTFLQWNSFDYANNILVPFIKTVNMWSWILVIFGYSAKYLNKESDLVKRRNKAVYPFYILHQTITIICGYYLMNSDLHYLIKLLIMIVVTFGGSWVIYEFIILKIRIIQPLFGLKKQKD